MNFATRGFFLFLPVVFSSAIAYGSALTSIFSYWGPAGFYACWNPLFRWVRLELPPLVQATAYAVAVALLVVFGSGSTKAFIYFQF